MVSCLPEKSGAAWSVCQWGGPGCSTLKSVPGGGAALASLVASTVHTPGPRA